MAVILPLVFSAILVTTSKIFGSCYTVENVTAPIIGGLDEVIWSTEENFLYWVYYYAPTLFRMDGITGEITNRTISFGAVGFIMPVRGYPGYVVVGVRTSVFLLQWGAPGGDTALRLLNTIDAGRPDNLIDEGKADAVGRLFYGCFGSANYSLPGFVNPDEATVYKIDANNYANPEIVLRPISWFSGTVWSLDNATMYIADAVSGDIIAYNYDISTGSISSGRSIFNFYKNSIPGSPDKLTIDVNGSLWCSSFNTTIIQINPITGEILSTIDLSATVDRVTGLAWGGCCLDTLYVTTSDENEFNPKSMSGALLKITDLGTYGVPTNLFVFPGADVY